VGAACDHLIGASMETMTFGVEEEFLIVDLETRELASRSHDLLGPAERRLGPAVCQELNLCQVEIETPVCTKIDEIRQSLIGLRKGLTDAAAEIGTGVIAAGTHPFSSWRTQQIDVEVERYAEMDDRYQVVARQQVICGCHIHVGIEDRDLAVAIMNRVRLWLPILLALSGNSPFWQGLDTGFDSYRMQVWQRWPTSGMPPELRNAREFDELVRGLEMIDAIEDATFLYWYVRPSSRYPTLEFRVCDVCLTPEETTVLAALVRSLTWSCAREASVARPMSTPRPELLEAAVWRAGRYGLGSKLISPLTLTPRPAHEVVGELMAFVRDGLDAHGEREEVEAMVEEILGWGNGAHRQRKVWKAAEGDGAAVVDYVLGKTASSSA